MTIREYPEMIEIRDIDVQYKPDENDDHLYELFDVCIEYWFEFTEIRTKYEIEYPVDRQSNVNPHIFGSVENHPNHKLYKFRRVFEAGEFLYLIERAGCKIADHAVLQKIADHCLYDFWLMNHFNRTLKNKT